jgi:cytoskeletal protein RodZ
MNSKNPFEEYIKNSLEHYEPEVSPHIWTKIDEKTRRKPIFWFYLRKYSWLLLILAAGGYGGFYLHSQSNKTKTQTELAFKSENSDKNNFNASEGKDESEQSTIEGNSGNLKDNSSDVVKNSVADNKKIKVEPEVKISAALKSISTPSASVNTNTLSTASKTKVKNSSGRKKMKMIAGNVADLLSEESADHITEMTPNIELSAVNENTAFKDLLERKNLHLEVSSKQHKDLSIPCPGSGNEAWGKNYIDIYAGPDFVFRQMSDSPNSDYLEKRKQSSSFYYAYSAGIRYTKVFSNGVSFRVGLNYSEVTEKFDFIQGNIIQIIYVTDAAGDTIGSYQTSSTRHKLTFNKYRTLDIPAVIGYEWATGRWNFNFNGGVMVNVYSWNRGVVLDRTLQPVVISSSEKANPYQFKTNIGLGAIASGSVYYGLNERLKIFAEPYFRFNLSSMSKSEQSLKQRFHTAGLRFGVRMDLK